MTVGLRSSSVTWSLGLPSTVFAPPNSAGEIVCIAPCFFDTGATISFSGFSSTLAASYFSATENGTALTQIFYKVSSGSEPGSYSYSSGSLTWADFVAWTMQGCDTTTPLVTYDRSGNDGTYSTGSVTVPSAGCFAMLPYCSFDPNYTGPPDPLTKLGDRGDSAAQLFGQAVSSGTLGPLTVRGSVGTANATLLAVFQPPTGGGSTSDSNSPGRDLLTGRLPHLRMKEPKGFKRRDRIYVPASL